MEVTNCAHCKAEGILPKGASFMTVRCPACGKRFGVLPSNIRKVRKSRTLKS